MKIFPTENEKIITVSIIFALVGLCMGLIAGNKSTDASFVITSLATLLAAYLGAKFAFKWQNQQLLEQKIADEVAAGNKALFEIIRTYNKFVAIRNQFINPHRNDPMKHYLIMPITGLDHHVTKIDYDSLIFLIQTKEPDLINQLSGFEQEANSTIDAINHRSMMHFDHVQPAIEEAENKYGSTLTQQQIDSAVGVRYKSMMEMSTDTMIECVDSVIALAENYISKLSGLLKHEFKGHNIIRMEVLKKSSNLTGAENAPSS